MAPQPLDVPLELVRPADDETFLEVFVLSFDTSTTPPRTFLVYPLLPSVPHLRLRPRAVSRDRSLESSDDRVPWEVTPTKTGYPPLREEPLTERGYPDTPCAKGSRNPRGLTTEEVRLQLTVEVLPRQVDFLPVLVHEPHQKRMN